MIQNNLDRTLDILWELPNIQYFPDDSAPPIPNSSMTLLDPNSKSFHGSQGVASYSEDDLSVKTLADLPHFTGVFNSANYDYHSGVTNFEIDQLFYSYLNVDTTIPYKYVENNVSRFDFIFRDFIPSLCGLYTIEVPTEGHHLGFWMNVINPAHSTYSYGINSLGKLMYTGIPGTSDFGKIVDKNPESGKKFNYIDFVFERLSGTSQEPIKFKSSNYEIVFEFERNLNRLDVFINDTNLSESTNTLAAFFNLTDRDLNGLFIVRLDFLNSLISMMWDTSNGHKKESTAFVGVPTNIDFSLLEFPWKPSILYSSCQIIGYNKEIGLEDLYLNVLRPKKYWQLPLHSSDIANSSGFVLPPYSGNAWAYMNNIFSTYEFRRIV